MKRKLIFSVALITVLTCMLAVSVSAAGSESDAFGVAETLDGISVDMDDTSQGLFL